MNSEGLIGAFKKYINTCLLAKSISSISSSVPDPYLSVGVPNLVQKTATAASQFLTNCLFNNSCGLSPDSG
ncbi:hypothetical protein [Anaerococcus hydrogenalis]|uniref:hypothetical protein n=1 Tax=Anaerococcus hydrogenalis TaxID=33029 RepID=UPI0028FDD9BB|nr:hypothetical protein [Anaerococcus hydrogenalis]MDU1317050.1 hypothetical protein [Anaerococcus hydrogenalis]